MTPKPVRAIRPWWVISISAVLISAATAGYWLFADLPALDSLSDHLNVPSIRITDRNGRTLYDALDTSGGRHIVVPLDAIPLALQQATIATEDSNFYHHPGVDLTGILRALSINLRGGETIAGGSTITQQVARNLLLDADERYQRNMRRKLREIWLAWQLARHYERDEILALYLNQMNYGGMAYGVEAAAQTYFGKPAAELDLAESALLAGLPQAPALYNPYTDPEAAKARQLIVLGLMAEQGYISPEARDLAEGEALNFESSPYPMEAPHFVLWVRAQLDAILPPGSVSRSLVVRTSLDLDWQHHAERAIQHQLESLGEELSGLGHNLNNAALVAINPTNGEILSMVGSPDYFDEDHAGAINMALAQRQPGSALKPLVYAAALNPAQAQPWTAATMILDVSTTFSTGEGEPYTPVNYDSQQHGPVLVRQALASSLNVPAVITLDHVGLEPFASLADRMGIHTLNDPHRYDLSIALGGGEVSLLELSAAYTVFANGGWRVEPVSILEITDSEGELVYSAPRPAPMRIIDERVAWLISDILSDNDARSLGFGAYSSLQIDRPAAVKTGTTSNFHDNWTVGYTPDLVVGVWAGNTSHEPMYEVSGLSGAAPIWHQFIRTVLEDSPERAFPPPPGLVQVEVCALSGLLPTETCPYHRLEWFIDGTQPTQEDNLYRRVEVDITSGLLADDSTPPERVVSRVVLDLPPEAQSWASTQGITLLSALTAASNLDISTDALRLASPAANAVYFIAPSLPRQTQRLHLEALAQGGMQQVSCWLDGELIGVSRAAPFEFWWPLQEGEHQAWVTGTSLTGVRFTSPVVAFTVKSADE